MKIIFLFLFLAVSSVFCDSSEEVIEKVKSKHLKQYLSHNKNRMDEGLAKLEKHCPGVSDKLKDAVLQFSNCAENTDDSLTVCAEIQTYTLNCTRPVLKVVDDCLPDKAKGLPTLGLKSLLSAADYLCKIPGENIFEFGNSCIYEDTEANADPECEKKILDLANKYKDEKSFPSQSEICSNATGLRGCVEKRLKTSCKNPKTKGAVLGLFDALVAPCNHISKA